MNGVILFLALYAIVFLLPGWLVWTLLRLRAASLLFSVAVSCGLNVAAVMAAAYLQASPLGLAAAWAGGVVLLAGAVLWRRHFERRTDASPCGRTAGRAGTRRVFWPSVAMIGLGVCVTAYFLYAGPYTELPADAWEHLNKIQDQLEQLQAQQPVPAEFSHIFSLGQGLHWYWLAAFLCRASGLTLAGAMGPLALANTLLFTLSLGSFFWAVSAREHMSAAAKAGLTILAVIFTLAHQGVSVFAYIRYYTYAPTMLNFVVYLALALVMLRFLRGAPVSARALWLLPLFGLTLLKVHTQEAVFAFVICWAMGLAAAFGCWRRGGLGGLGDRLGRRALGVAGAGTLLFVAGFVRLHFYHAPGTAYLDRLVSLGALGSWAGSLLVVNPAGECFQTVTLWGCLVYALFFVFWKPLACNPYVAGGMAVPLLVWFNPLTVDMCLRYASAASILYRFGYIIPLGYVAAYAAFRLAGMIRQAGQRPWQAVPAALALVALLVLLLPVRIGGWENPHSRIFTLKKTPPACNFRHWGDVVEEVRALGKKHIVTDSLTSLFLRPLTGVQCADRMASMKGVAMSGQDLPVVLTQLELASDSILLVNQRDGGASETWRRSGHWPANILEVSRRYSPISQAFIREQPGVFRPCWSNNNVALYTIDQVALQPLLPVEPVMTDARPVMLEGPGIYIEWTSVRKQDFIGYHIQVSEDGSTWRDLYKNREHCYPWLNHQGSQDDRVGQWTYCLPSGKTYHYRVRAVFSSGTSCWSNIKSALVAAYR